MIHVCLVGLTHNQEWELTDDEAKNVGQCGANVARHYNWLQGTEKVQDWANLVMCCAIVYGGRMSAIRARKRNERANRGLGGAFQQPAQPTAPDGGDAVIPGVGRMQSGGLH